jgi:hypothetical protein
MTIDRLYSNKQSPTIKKDFKNLTLPDSETSFALGFTTALALIAGILKLTNVI